MLDSNYYDSVDDILLYNWRKCQEGDLTFTRKRHEEIDNEKEKRVWWSFVVSMLKKIFYKKQEINLFVYTEEQDSVVWDKIYDSYIEEFTLGEDWDRIHELREEISILQCDFVIYDNNFLRNKIEALKDELNEFLDRPVKGDMDGCLIRLGQWMNKGGPLDSKTITVREFYKMLDQYNDEHEQLKEAS